MMGPRRLVTQQQLDLMLNFLEQNRDVMLRGTPAPGTLMPGDINAARTKWCLLARMLNAENGHRLTPIGWRKVRDETYIISILFRRSQKLRCVDLNTCVQRWQSSRK